MLASLIDSMRAASGVRFSTMVDEARRQDGMLPWR